MTTEPKLLTEQHAACILAMEPAKALAELRERGLISEEPVEPMLEEAREMAAAKGRWTMYSPDDVRKGKHDDDQRVQIALAALRRGREIGLAERPTLTREMVRELIIDARPKYLSPGDFEGRYGKKNKEAAEAFVTRLHTAIQEALQ